MEFLFCIDEQNQSQNTEKGRNSLYQTIKQNNFKTGNLDVKKLNINVSWNDFEESEKQHQILDPTYSYKQIVFKENFDFNVFARYTNFELSWGNQKNGKFVTQDYF